MLKIGDILLFILIIVLSISIYTFRFFSSNSSNLTALIIQNDKVIQKVNLNNIKNNKRIQVTGNYNMTILVSKNKIRFEESDCPHKTCVKTGWLSNKGDVSVCLPGKTLIKIKGEKYDVDVITH